MTGARLASIAVITLAVGACKRDREHAAAPAPSAVPSTRAPIEIDGQWNDPDWNKTALRLKLRGLDGDDADLARPYSEARFVHDASNLYVGLYASDLDIRSTDVFEVQIGPLAVQINPAGKVTPASPDIAVGSDADGTIDDPHDHDEEWKLEIAIPLARTGLAPGTPVDARVGRCDVPPRSAKRCGEWRGRLAVQ